jgi:hypothetical protein
MKDIRYHSNGLGREPYIGGLPGGELVHMTEWVRSVAERLAALTPERVPSHAELAADGCRCHKGYCTEHDQ